MARKPNKDGTMPGGFADFAREAQQLGREGFVREYGDAFLLLHAADLTGRQPGDTSIPSSSGNTAATTFHVFAVRKSDRNQRDYISIGREDDNDVVIHDRTISRNHAGIFPLGDGEYGVRDLGSSNGTFIKDDPVASADAFEPTVLETRASLRCGSVTLKFMKAPEFLDFVEAFLGPFD